MDYKVLIVEDDPMVSLINEQYVNRNKAFRVVKKCKDGKSALAYIRREYESVPKTDVPLVEPLDGKYCRVHLSCLNGDMEPETLAKLFCLSAKKESSGKADLIELAALSSKPNEKAMRKTSLLYDRSSFFSCQSSGCFDLFVNSSQIC